MSEVKRTTTWFPQEIGGSMLEEVVRACDYDAAQSELAALREELATAQRGLAKPQTHRIGTSE